MASTDRKVFLRDATGLVRGLSWYETFGMNMTFINVVGGFLVTLLFLYYFPGVNIPLMFALGAVPTIGMFIVYAILSAGMPRTGGDYLFTGRILGQPIGFAQGLMNMVGFYITTLGGFNAWLTFFVDAPPLLYAMGITTNNSGLVSLGLGFDSNLPLGFAVSTLAVIVGALFVIFGLTWYKRMIKYVFNAYLIFGVILVILLLPMSNSGFISAYNTFAGSSGAYQATLTNAGQYGSFVPSLTQTLLAFIPLGFLTFTGFQSSVIVGGEVRNPKKSQPLALGLSVIVTTILLVVLSLESVNVFGSSFLEAVSYLWALAPSKLPLPVTPYPTLYVTLYYGNPALAFVLNLLPVLGNFMMLPSVILVGSRMLFSWSFDRIIPARVAAVQERFHSPIFSVVLLAVLIEVWTYVLYFEGIVSSWLVFSIVIPVAWMLPGVAALLFPFVRKDLYERTIGVLPGWYSKKIGGLPLLSIGGILLIVTMLVWIFQQVLPIITFTYLGASLPLALGLTGGLFVIGIVAFYVSRAYHLNKEGLDISLAGKEVPPE
jgi:amino acid transporter